MIRSTPTGGSNELMGFLHYTENSSYLTFLLPLL